MRIIRTANYEQGQLFNKEQFPSSPHKPLIDPNSVSDEPLPKFDEKERLIQIYDKKYPRAGSVVDGRTVIDRIDNTGSISASFIEYEVLKGIREVPTSDFSYAHVVNNRTKELAHEIQQSEEIMPLIVAIDERGPWILEGSHRIDALKIINAKSFPALVVIDLDP